MISFAAYIMHSLVIFASGTGTNATAIVNYFKKTDKATVSLIVSNNPNAGVLEMAKRENIPFLIINKQTFHEALLIEQLSEYNSSLIILAGFMWKVPQAMVDAFRDKIINIHPALLPAYGGKGMYGHHVHHAVIGAQEKESGITIHYVNEHYDEGNIILQARCKVDEKDSPDELANRIHKLEHFYYPRVVEYLLGNLSPEEVGGV